jgi:hypothetical protein
MRIVKTEREKRDVHQFKQRADFTDTHHLKPRSRGGQSTTSNTAQLDAYRHDAFHLLFGDKTPQEAAELLLRFAAIKNGKKLFLKICY